MLSWISTVRRELVGLFVEDGSFALAVLAWLAGGAICIHLIGVDPVVEGLLLAAGFIGGAMGFQAASGGNK